MGDKHGVLGVLGRGRDYGQQLVVDKFIRIKINKPLCKLAFRNIFVNKIVILCCVNLKLRKIFILFLNSCFRWLELLALLGIKVVVHIEYQSLAQET